MILDQIEDPSPARAYLLQKRAMAQRHRHPRAARLQAHAAHVLAQRTAQPLPLLHAIHTQCVIANACGEFSDVISFGERGIDLAQQQHDGIAAIAYYGELGWAYAEMRRNTDAWVALQAARRLGNAEPTGVAQKVWPEHSLLLRPFLLERLEALILHYRHEHVAAIELVQQLLASHPHPPAVKAQLQLDLAQHLFLIDAHAALRELEIAEQLFAQVGYSVELAHVDHFRALAFHENNQYGDALVLHHKNRHFYRQAAMPHYVAWTENMICVNQWRLNHFDAAIAAGERAHRFFLKREMGTLAAMCANNLAIVDHSLNHYDDALGRYAAATALCFAQNLPIDAARCQRNMALTYVDFGRYEQALPLFAQARALLAKAGLMSVVAECDQDMANLCRRLGRYQAAYAHCKSAEAIFAAQGRRLDVAHTHLQMAQLQMALGEVASAALLVETAKQTFRQHNMPLQFAHCLRLLARINLHQGLSHVAIQLLNEARQYFQAQELIVDVALCDVALGETYLQTSSADATSSAMDCAVAAFQNAIDILDPAFPDEAWRAYHGLALCYRAWDAPQKALPMWLAALRCISKTRSALPTEQLSSEFFAARAEVYLTALTTALACKLDDEAFTIVEASKRQAFVGRTAHPQRQEDDTPYVASLRERESDLRQQMEDIRYALRHEYERDPAAPPDHQANLRLPRLRDLAQQYEATVEQLRSLHPLQTEPPALPSLKGLRESATHLARRWAYVSYYDLNDRIVAFYVDANQFSVYINKVGKFERKLLELAADPASHHLFYGDVISAQPNGAPSYLCRLYDLLMPPEIETMQPDDLLFLAPHRSLHMLPFAALSKENRPLVERVTPIVAPSLAMLCTLLKSPAPAALRPALLCGVTDFHGVAAPLPWVRNEVESVRRLLGTDAHVLWQSQATRSALLELNQQDTLAGYRVLHFATHAVLDALAPSQSRILLYTGASREGVLGDGNLTFFDISTLRLCTRMVLLATCASAVGRALEGNELMSLAWAFLQAGTRTVVASLWPIADDTTSALIDQLYHALYKPDGNVDSAEMTVGEFAVAEALCHAQRTMRRGGQPASAWASFVVIGSG